MIFFSELRHPKIRYLQWDKYSDGRNRSLGRIQSAHHLYRNTFIIYIKLLCKVRYGQEKSHEPNYPLSSCTMFEVPLDLYIIMTCFGFAFSCVSDPPIIPGLLLVNMFRVHYIQYLQFTSYIVFSGHMFPPV